jgi:hypothetical protein
MTKKEYLILPLLFIISFSYLIFFCKYGFNIADEGIPLSGALRIMRGEVPLKDFQGYMPAGYYFYYIILKTFGVEILALRYVISFLTAIIAVIYYLASRKIMSIPFSLFGVFIIVTVPGAYGARFTALFIIINIIAFAYMNEKILKPFYMGLIGGITLLYRQDLGLFILFLAVVIFFIKRYIYNNGKYIESFNEIKRYIMGYFLIIFPVIIYYLYENKLFYILRINYRGFFGGYQKVSVPFPKLSLGWHEIGLFYTPILIYLFASVLIINRLKNKHKEGIYKLFILLLGILSFNQAIWRTEPGNIVRVILPAIMLYFYLFEFIFKLMPKFILRWIVVIIFSIIPLSYVYAMNKYYGTYIGSMPFSPSKYKFMDIQRAKIYAPIKEATEYKEIVSFIKNNTIPNDKIFIVPFIGIPLYFLSDRINPTYFEWILPPDIEIYPNIESEIIKSLIKDKTKLIVYVDFALDGLENRRFKNYAPKLYQWIIDNYCLAEIIGDYQILKLKSEYNCTKNPFFHDLDYSIKETPDNEYIKKIGMNVSGDRRITLFEHPPSMIRYKMRIPENSLLNFGIAIDPQAWNTKAGDGVKFEILINEGKTEKVLFSRYINPKVSEDERRWIDNSIDLSDYGGREVILSLRTSAGPKDDNSYDWAGWSELEFVTKD